MIQSRRQPAIIAILLFLLGAILISLMFVGMKTGAGIGTYDLPFHNWMVEHRSFPLTVLFQVITTLGSPAWICTGTVLGASIWAWRSRSIWQPFLLGSAVLTGFAATSLIKHSVARLRPPTIDMVAPLETDFSFPSGHVIGVAVLAIVLAYLLTSRKPSVKRIVTASTLALIAIVATALSRIYLGYHWPTDTLASLGLAFIICSIVAAVDTIQATRAASSTGR